MGNNPCCTINDTVDQNKDKKATTTSNSLSLTDENVALLPQSPPKLHSRKSSTMSLDSFQKSKLGKKRESLILMQKNKNHHNLPIKITKIWKILTKYVIDNDDNDDINIYNISLTYDQFNIVLNNNNIEVSPDMSTALISCLLDVNQIIMIDNDNDNNLSPRAIKSVKSRSFNSAQFKFISSSLITYKMIDKLIRHLNDDINGITSEDKACDPKNLNSTKLHLVIWSKIFSNLFNSIAFNIESDYLYGSLTVSELNDIDGIISCLNGFTSHWSHRVQIMEYISSKLSKSDPDPDADHAINDLSPLQVLSDDNIIQLLNVWSIQLTDDRSNVSRIAVNLLPTLLSSLSICCEFPSILFNESDIINPIYYNILNLVKNKRFSNMSLDAYNSLIEITDIFTEISEDLDDYELLKIIVNLLEKQSNININKHNKSREACIVCISSIIYGINFNNIKKEKQELLNLNVIPQRKYLLINNEFVRSLGNILLNGITDKSELCRTKTFELCEKFDKSKILNNSDYKWDNIIFKKYKNWKKLKLKKLKKMKSKKKLKKKKNKKKKNKKKIKNPITIPVIEEEKSEFEEDITQITPNHTQNITQNPIKSFFMCCV